MEIFHRQQNKHAPGTCQRAKRWFIDENGDHCPLALANQIRKYSERAFKLMTEKGYASDGHLVWVGSTPRPARCMQMSVAVATPRGECSCYHHAFCTARIGCVRAMRLTQGHSLIGRVEPTNHSFPLALCAGSPVGACFIFSTSVRLKCTLFGFY